jgi:VWFA-related protein
LSASSALKALPQQEPAQTTPPVIKTNVNEVLLPVVVRDAKGQTMSGLSKENFQVFDNGKPQEISGFTVIARANVSPATDASTVNSSAANPATSPTNAPRPAASARRFIVFLFDDFNMNVADLTQARLAATTALDKALLPGDLSAVISTSGSNSGLTQDRAKLKQAIMDLRTKDLYRHDDHDCPNVNYYQGDLIQNKNDAMALEAAVSNAMACAHLSDPSTAESMARSAAQRAVALGEQNYRTNLNFLHLVISKMASLPGQRVVILVSSGFLAPDAEAMTLKSEILDVAARANVVVNAIDARGLYTTGQDAEVTSRAGPDAQRLLDQYHHDSMVGDEDVMAELADGTGGTFFRHNNDLEGGLDTLIFGPEVLYLLTFSNAKMKSNGAYHSLKVKVNQSGTTIQARRGYFAPSPEKGKK